MVSESNAMGVDQPTRWTGGQFSVLRILIGATLAIHFARSIPFIEQALHGVAPSFDDMDGLAWADRFRNGTLDGEHVLGTIPLLFGTVIAILFALGLRVRVAAAALIALLIWESSVHPSISNPSVGTLGLLVLYCAFQAPAPIGSWAARGRPDPAGGWREVRWCWNLLWIGYWIGGASQVWALLWSFDWPWGTTLRYVFQSPFSRSNALNSWLVELPDLFWQVVTALVILLWCGALVAALSRRTRAYAWLALLGLNLFMFLGIDLTERSIASLLFLLAMFDPTWLAPKSTSRPTWVFYDGDCGLCHRLVRLILAEDQSGNAFRFAPLRSQAFESRVSESERANLPDSVAVLDASGTLSVRSAAVLQILDGLGGLWRMGALCLRVVPRPLADFGYDQVAHVRKKLFAQPKVACPLIPPGLASRFELDS